jgi:hypothetical protein
MALNGQASAAAGSRNHVKSMGYIPAATERLYPGSSRNTRILSAVVETMTCAISCNPSAAGHATRIWRAASPGDGACKREILG